MTDADQIVRVWDLPTRVFHWLVVTLVVVAYVTWKLNWMDWHTRAGYTLLTLVLFRILWGFFGSDTAQFARFLASPRAATQHLKHLFLREPDQQVGHNAAGGWMVMMLLALLLGETLTGVYVLNDVADEGPLTELTPAPIANAITALHGFFWDALLAGATLHMLAILVYAIAKGHNLLRPMVTGYKSLPADVRIPHMAGLSRALILLGCSALAVAAIARFV
jgi:cytochrome b